jgi:hypothetical protein
MKSALHALKMVTALMQFRGGIELGKAGSHVSAAARFGGSMGMNFAAVESICSESRDLDDAGQVIGTAGWVGAWYATRAIATDDATRRKGFWVVLGVTYLSSLVLANKKPMRVTQRLAQIGSGLGLADVGRVQALPQVRKLGLLSASLSAAAVLIGISAKKSSSLLLAQIADIAAVTLNSTASKALALDVRSSRL